MKQLNDYNETIITENDYNGTQGPNIYNDNIKLLSLYLTMKLTFFGCSILIYNNNE